jgi:hypothetical protein
VKTRSRQEAIVEVVQHDQPMTRVAEHDSVVRHPIRTTVHDAEHLRDIAAEGQSAATPAIIAAAVIVFITPVAALLMVLAFGIAHFA